MVLPKNYLTYLRLLSVVAEPNSFWKRYKFAAVAALTLLFIYSFAAFNQKLNFFLGNEPIVYLAPNEKSFSMNYGNISEIEFNISIGNAAYCKSACSYSFNDRSRDEVIDRGSFELSKKQQFTKAYNLSVKRLGSGQDIYSFDTACKSVRSLFCLTKSPEKSRSSLVTVNYDLTETEKKLKEILRKNVTKLLGLLSDADIMHQQLSQKYFELGFRANLKNLSKKKIEIDDKYDKARISIENLRSLWSVENYIGLNLMFNESLFATLDGIKASVKELNESIDSAVAKHNGLLSELEKLSASLKSLESFVYILEDNASITANDANIKNLNMLASSIANNTFESYASLAKGIADIALQHASITVKSRDSAAELFFSSEYSLKSEKDMLCSLQSNCMENISVAGMLENAAAFIKEYPGSARFGQNCNSLKSINQTYSDIRNESSRIISDKNISFPNDSMFLAFASGFIENKAREINNSYYDSLEKAKLENNSNQDAIKIAESILPKNKTDAVSLQYNSSINVSLYLLSKIEASGSVQDLLKKCQKPDETAEKAGSFNLQPVSLNITYSILQKISANLSDNPPVCCVFNGCKPCCRDDSCRNDQKTFPVIFVHGHSLAKDNSPEFSLDAFNKIQSKLQENGYLNAGIVSLSTQNEQSQAGIWGLSGKPVTVKVSYYYDAFRKEDKYIVVPTKSENIDTYALRLKDLIGIVKERTNKPKVNLIAHSMGGLVARRYMQIFGDNDIDKLIMIAVPNNGISGAISDYCGFVGESRECQDMQENSLFINKLNDPLRQPEKAKLYSIIGQGCQMKLGNGDGVVLAENTKLENAKLYFVNGTCSGLFGGNLHTEMLNIEKYPQVYEILAEALKE